MVPSFYLEKWLQQDGKYAYTDKHMQSLKHIFLYSKPHISSSTSSLIFLLVGLQPLAICLASFLSFLVLQMFFCDFRSLSPSTQPPLQPRGIQIHISVVYNKVKHTNMRLQEKFLAHNRKIFVCRKPILQFVWNPLKRRLIQFFSAINFCPKTVADYGDQIFESRDKRCIFLGKSECRNEVVRQKNEEEELEQRQGWLCCFF